MVDSELAPARVEQVGEWLGMSFVDQARPHSALQVWIFWNCSPLVAVQLEAVAGNCWQGVPE